MAETEKTVIDIEVRAEKGAKNLDELTKKFQALMDKARKANPSLIAVENRLKTLKNAMVSSADATVELRKNITTEIKVLSFLRDELKAVEKAERARGKSVSKSEEELDAAGRRYMETLREQFKSIEAVDKELSILTVRMAEARKETALSDLQFDEQLTKWAQKKHQLNELKREYKSLAQIEKDVAKAAEDAAKKQVKAAEEAAAAQEKQSKSIGRLIKQIVLWGVGSASLYYIWRKIRTGIIEATKAVYGNTVEAQRLTAAWDKLKISLVLSLTEYKSTTEALSSLAIWLGRVAQDAIETRAEMDAEKQTLAAVSDQLGKFGKVLYSVTTLSATWTTAVSNSIRWLDELRGGVLGLNAVYDEAYDTSLDFNTGIVEASKSTADYSSQVSSLVSQMRTFNDAAAAQATAIRQIEQAFRDASAVARGNYASALMQIDIDLQKQITSINKKALESRADAYEDYQDKLNNLQRDGNKARQNDAERHALEMEFAQRRHNLSLIQNERMYQYSRGLLVAEGDVLAIEDLDARYALEKQAAEENFALQQQQAEAMFRLQAKIQADAMRDQVAALQLGLRQQLAEIEEGRREEIAEAQAAAQEKEAQAADEYATALAAAMQAQQEELKAQEEGQAEREKALADFFVDMAMEMGIGYEDALGIAKRYFDVGGSFDSLMKTEWERQATYIAIFTEAINTAINALTLLGNKARSIGGRGGRTSSLPSYVTDSQTPRLYAHGTDTIVSSPTTIGVGERGPERLIVQPLSPIGVGGNVSMSWRGGPIPIHGTGGMSGIDEGAIGNAIAQGIVDQMALSFSSIRGSRGN